MKNAFVFVAALGLLSVPSLSFGSGSGHEHHAPSNPMVAYRHTNMSAMGKHMKAMGMVVKGKVAYKGDLVAHSVALYEASKHLADLFPAGTGPDKVETEAKAEVWTKSGDFAKAVKAFNTESAKLVDVAKGGDFAAFQKQFGAVGGTCGDCHDAFQKEDDDD